MWAEVSALPVVVSLVSTRGTRQMLSQYITWRNLEVYPLAAYLQDLQHCHSVQPFGSRWNTQKLRRYHIFQPIAVESLGPINQSDGAFLSNVGRRLSIQSGDERETSFVFQTHSIVIQYFTAILLHIRQCTLCSKKNWTTKGIVVTLSHLNRFSKFFHC